MTRVKVGLDQWVIAHNSANVQLITNGLSGCVALGSERYGAILSRSCVQQL